MGLISKEVEVGLTRNIKYYENLGYIIPREKDQWGRLRVPKTAKIKVSVKDLTESSNVFVNVRCDGCNKLLNPIKWQIYKKHVHDDNKYYCNKCSSNLFGTEKAKKTKLENSESFEHWCMKNNREDLLNRWDYKLNNCSPNEISYSSHEEYYFKCPRGIHESELKIIKRLTQGISVKCNYCNSLAQWFIDNLGEDAINNYWSERNNISPYNISKGQGKTKFYFICQENTKHKNYLCTPKNFVNGSRCPRCNESKGEKQLDLILSKYNIYHSSQYTFDDLRGIGGGLLRFDAPVFWDADKTKLRMLIEYDGIFHYEKQYDNDRFETLLIHDELKNQYCNNNNIKLLRIPYWEFSNIEEILIREIGYF